MDDYAIKRRAVRTKIEVPVILEDGTGLTRDISVTGIYMKTARPYMPGDLLKFTLELEYAIPDGPMQFTCVGRVVRVEQLEGEYGIASTIEDMNTLH
jgi:hypothetical protein